MNSKMFQRLSGALLVVLCSAVAVRGEIVTFEFAGRVSWLNDPEHLFDGRVAEGTAATASLRYDTATADLYPDDPGRGTYQGPGWLMFDVGGLKFGRTTWVQLDVFHHGDGKEIFSGMAIGEMTDWAVPGAAGDFLRLLLIYYQVEPTFTMLENDAPPTRVNFSEASHTIFEVGQWRENGPNVFTLGMVMTPVPEPATWALLGLGFAGVCWRARRS